MLEKYKKLYDEALGSFVKADNDGALESAEYFDGQVSILKQIVEDLESK